MLLYILVYDKLINFKEERIMAYQFLSPTVLDCGIGAVEKLGEYLEMFGAEKVLVVCDEGVKSIGLVDDIIDLIEDSGFDAVVWDGVQPDPPVEVVDSAIDFARSEDVNSIVVVGGGSSIDTAKAINVALSAPKDYKEYLGQLNTVPNRGLPLIAIPTTSGTGSETSFFSVITDTEKGKKSGIISPLIAPHVAIVDANMTKTLPQHITVATGIDALTHAMETCTTTVANPISDAISFKATRMIVKNLPEVYNNPDNLEARQEVAEAAAMGAIAFNSSFFHVCHAISHAIGAVWHVPHGIACAYGLVYGIEHIAEEVPEKIREFSKIFDVDGHKDMEISNLKVALKDSMLDFYDYLNVPKLREFKNVKQEEFDVAIDAMEREMLDFGPFCYVKPTREFFNDVLVKSY